MDIKTYCLFEQNLNNHMIETIEPATNLITFIQLKHISITRIIRKKLMHYFRCVGLLLLVSGLELPRSKNTILLNTWVMVLIGISKKINLSLIDLAFASVVDMAIFPLQDILSLDNRPWINDPSINPEQFMILKYHFMAFKSSIFLFLIPIYRQ